MSIKIFKHDESDRAINLKLFVMCSIAVFFFLLINNERDMFGDAYDYLLASSQFNYESFSLKGFTISYRGYLLPLIYYIIGVISFQNADIFFILLWIAKSISFSFLIVYLIPSLIEVKYKKSVVVCILYAAICCFFFRGLLVYTLSDMFALVVTLSSVWFYLKSIESQKNSLLLCFCAGMCMTMAYYVRPIYLSTYVVLIIFSTIRSVKNKKIDILFMLLASIIVAVPQIIINKASFCTYSPLIQTQIQFGESLYLQQLFWGVGMQRYETNFNLDIFPEYRVVFKDFIGEKLLEQDGITSFTSYLDYIKFVISHFFDVCIMYIRHLFNGLDIVYTNVYIKNLYGCRFFVQLINYVLMFFGCSELLKQYKKVKFNSTLLIKILALGLPILLVLPTAVECRYFTLLSCVIYYFAVNSIVCKIKEHERITFVGVVKLCITLVLCFLINSGTFESLGIPLW